VLEAGSRSSAPSIKRYNAPFAEPVRQDRQADLTAAVFASSRRRCSFARVVRPCGGIPRAGA
jgi:hypothetical protein